jgi:hypothetical protein
VSDDNGVGEYTLSGAMENASLIPTWGPLAVEGNDLFAGDGSTIGEYTTSGATVNASLISLDASGLAVEGNDVFASYGAPPP